MKDFDFESALAVIIYALSLATLTGCFLWVLGNAHNELQIAESCMFGFFAGMMFVGGVFKALENYDGEFL